MDDLADRLRDASVPLTLEMAMEGYVQDSHAVALHEEAADRIEQLEAELRFEKDQRIDYSPHAERMRRIQVELERDEARAEVERLREALRQVCDDAFSDGEGAMRSYLADTEEADDA